jgi:hypothetical protein
MATSFLFPKFSFLFDWFCGILVQNVALNISCNDYKLDDTGNRHMGLSTIFMKDCITLFTFRLYYSIQQKYEKAGMLTVKSHSTELQKYEKKPEL